MTNIIKTNKYQTEVTQELIDTLPSEVFSNLLEYIETVELISTLINPDVKTIENSVKDEDGLVIVDVTKPHMLENMDYFREAALHFQKYGKYTLLTPNAHPKSPYKLHWKEEKKRCLEGLVRPDGEWIPGDLYFYWNYCPIMLTKQVGNTKKALRVKDFPKPWLGDYLFFHYKDQADKAGKHIAVIKMRGVGASFKAGEIGIRRTVLMKNQKTFYTAYDKQFLNQDGVLNKAWNYLDFLAENTPFPRMRLKDSLNRMELRMGYKDLDTNAEKGSKGEIIGISSKDDPDKIRGKRGTIYFEEFGKFPKLSDTWNVCRDSTEDGGVAYDMLVAMGTGGTEGADFQGAEDMIYNPDTYNILGIRNVFDKNASDGKVCFHWGAYLNRNLCYDDNGNPDVIKALIEVLTEFYDIKQTSSDSKALTQRRAEKCITIQDAVMRTDGTLFPVVDLKDYLAEIRVKGIKFFKKHYIVNLILSGSGVKYELTDKFPLRKYKYDVNHKEGAIEIFELPKNGSDGLPMRGRYIAGIDPYDDDQGTSLGSIFVFDLINDVIVAEYTGRPKLANDFYEICRRMLILYNAEALYENNKKGLFTYFVQQNSVHLLADAPQTLIDQHMTKVHTNNKRKGIHAILQINRRARLLINDWMITTANANYQDYDENGNLASNKLNMHLVRSTALLEEAIAWNVDGNFDRISSMGMVMLLREEKKQYIDNIKTNNSPTKVLAEDDYFSKEFDERFSYCESDYSV